MPVAENIVIIEERIQKACDASGRKRDDVTLMAVSKFVPAASIQEAYNAGILCFGESRVKEALEKFETIREKLLEAQLPAVQLHMIGSLQRNKAKSAAAFFDCIQSVDRQELILELAKHAPLREKPLELLLELHTGEESKSGFEDTGALCRAAEQILQCANVKVRGLMTMAPFTEDREQVRRSFRQLVKAQKELERRFPPTENWACLSMGMSNDFEIAIEEGSTMLRIGSSIFKDL